MLEQRTARNTTRRIRVTAVLATAVTVICTACSATATTWPIPADVTQTSPVSRSDLTAADGYIPNGQSLSPNTNHPAITNLDPVLRAAVRKAARDAAEDGIDMVITTGWRSKRFQRVLLKEAITKYGSRAEALKWAATPDTSNHVTGEAVDVGPTAAASWLRRYGNNYGLCQTYSNEMWHYQLTVQPGQTCPVPLPNAVPESTSNG